MRDRGLVLPGTASIPVVPSVSIQHTQNANSEAAVRDWAIIPTVRQLVADKNAYFSLTGVCVLTPWCPSTKWWWGAEGSGGSRLRSQRVWCGETRAAVLLLHIGCGGSRVLTDRAVC